MAKMTKAQEEERQQAIEHLRDMLPPGSKVFTILRHVSRSGMFRIIDPVVLYIDSTTGKPECHSIWGWAGKVLGWGVDRDRGGVKVSGCGMDMGFHLVYSLSYSLYPDGYGCIGTGCPANDHVNRDRDYTPHGQSHTHWHNDGGYALKQQWI